MKKQLLILLSSIVSCAASAGYEESVAAYNAKNYSLTLQECGSLANGGNKECQNVIGVLYRNGQGVAQDYKLAADWFRKAAEQDNAKAQYNLGSMYNNGQGVAQDYKQAVDLFRKAAEQGNALAQNGLGTKYYYGQGVAQDYKQAVDLYRKAAEQGNASAQSNLGFMYINGQGVAQDYKQAVDWYRKAAEQGNATAQRNLGISYQNGDGLSKDLVLSYMMYNLAAVAGNTDAPKNRDDLLGQLSPKQIEEGQRLTAKWKTGTPLPTKSATGAVPEPKKVAVKDTTVGSKAKTGGNCRPTTQSVRCRSQCTNGDCVITYENGCQTRVQVNPKFNPFNNQWEYPAPSC